MRLSERILYREGGVLVLDKPAGLPTSGRSLDDPECVQFELMGLVRRKVWAVHQLDRDTSGVLVFVERRSLVPTWQARLGHPDTRKHYLALVQGRLPRPRTEVDAPIGPVDRRRRQHMVRRDGKPARTTFVELAHAGGFSLVEALLHTGRTHQIRVHLQHLGLSLLGEQRYRETPCDAHPRQALHAARLHFGDGLEPTSFLAPLPPDLRELRDRLGMGG